MRRTFIEIALAVSFTTGLAWLTPVSRAATTVGPWTPLFKGIDHSVSTNIPTAGSDFTNLQVVHALRVDLNDPDIHLLTTPQITDYIAGSREVGGLTVSDFLVTHKLQAAINANFFDRTTYYLPAGTPMDIYGLAISEGVIVSDQDDRRHPNTLLFDANNQTSGVHTEWPVKDLEGVYTAVAGSYPLVGAGKNLITRGQSFERDPRTVFGVSEDHRYLFLVAIDGRQPGYSEGANDYESAGWLLLLGAYEGMNLDGGGSTTLVIQYSTGVPVRLNESSAVADSGRERTVASHFGIYAKPLPGFINEVQAKADDTTAQITWTTVEPATGLVHFGTSTAPAETSTAETIPATNHIVQLGGLSPDTRYYFQVLSSTASGEYTSPLFAFQTTNYVTTNQVFSITNSWRYTVEAMTSTDWTAPGYDDSQWSGPGPGLLWLDLRAAGPTTDVQPKNTELPGDPNTGFPYVTYYFRTQFQRASVAPSTRLLFNSKIDDGAVIYLNGTEVYRLRMPPSSDASTLANAYPCEGDATCFEAFLVSNGPALVSGTNVLAVEVHNYNTRSADATFGLDLSVIEPVPRTAELSLQSDLTGVTLTWDGTGLVLQSADSLAGPWTDIPGTPQSPYSPPLTAASRFFRLSRAAETAAQNSASATSIGGAAARSGRDNYSRHD